MARKSSLKQPEMQRHLLRLRLMRLTPERCQEKEKSFNSPQPDDNLHQLSTIEPNLQEATSDDEIPASVRMLFADHAYMQATISQPSTSPNTTETPQRNSQDHKASSLRDHLADLKHSEPSIIWYRNGHYGAITVDDNLLQKESLAEAKVASNSVDERLSYEKIEKIASRANWTSPDSDVNNPSNIEQGMVSDSTSNRDWTKAQHIVAAYAPISTWSKHYGKTQAKLHDNVAVAFDLEECEADFAGHDFLNFDFEKDKDDVLAFAKYHQHISWIQQEPVICFYRTMKDLLPLEYKPSEDIDQERQICENWLTGELPAMIESFLDYSRNIDSNAAIRYQAYFRQLLQDQKDLSQDQKDLSKVEDKRP